MEKTAIETWIKEWGANLDWEAKVKLREAVQKEKIAELKVQVPERPTCNISELQKQVSSLELRVREQTRDIRKIVMIINAQDS